MGIGMEIECCVMREDWTVSSYVCSLPEGSCIKDAMAYLYAHAFADKNVNYAFSIYGERADQDTRLHPGDRLECVLSLPTDPKVRRRMMSLKRKNS